MAPKRDLIFNFVGDSKKLERAADRAGTSIDKVGTKTDRLGRKMSKFGKGLSVGVTLPIVAAFGVGFKSLIENEALLAQTNAAIKATGSAANVTGDEVLAMANDLSSLSGAAHENILEGANMLLTFKNIRNEVGEGNDVFDQTTKALLNMSIATGQDMKTGAVQLGKALNDPIKGVAALNRVGIQFTDAQKEQIKVLQESGDIMGAQKIILAELEGQFGGSAEAAGQTMAGSINRLKNSFEEIARNMASILIPVFEALSGVLQSVFGFFQGLSPTAQKFVGVLAILFAAVGPGLLIFAKLIKAFQAIKIAFLAVQATMLANPFILLIAAVIALVVLIVLNWDKIIAVIQKALGTIKAGVSTAWDFIKGVISRALDFVKSLFLNFTGPGLLLKHWDKIRAGILAVVGFFRAKWSAVVSFFTTIPGKISRAARGMWDGITAAFKAAINTIIRGWNRLELKIGGQRVDLPFGLGFSIPTITLRTPNIPEFHFGGVFRSARPGGEGLALLKDRERVTEGDRIEPGPGFDPREPFLVQLVVDGKVLAESLIAHEEAIA